MLPNGRLAGSSPTPSVGEVSGEGDSNGVAVAGHHGRGARLRGSGSPVDARFGAGQAKPVIARTLRLWHLAPCGALRPSILSALGLVPASYAGLTWHLGVRQVAATLNWPLIACGAKWEIAHRALPTLAS